MNKGQVTANREYCDWNNKGLEIKFIFRKFEGYIHSGIGSRSVPVSWQAGRLADWHKNM